MRQDMLAVIKDAPGAGYTLQEVPIPTPGPSDVLIRVRRVGLCGSDVPLFQGIRQVPLPLIPGHEFGGEVVDFGRAVHGWSIGNRVAVSMLSYCGKCLYCGMGREALCNDKRELGSDVDGAFAEYVVAPAANLYHIPDGLDWAGAASAEPIACALAAVSRANIMFEDTVVIVGDGPIGLYALQLARLAGPLRLFLVGHGATRLTVGRQWADETINGREVNAVDRALDLTSGQGANVVIEATGSATGLADALALAGRMARVGLMGIFHQTPPTPIDLIVRRELDVYGSLCYNHKHYTQALSMLINGVIQTEPIITHVLPLSQMQQGLDLFMRREAIKVQFEP